MCDKTDQSDNGEKFQSQTLQFNKHLAQVYTNVLTILPAPTCKHILGDFAESHIIIPLNCLNRQNATFPFLVHHQPGQNEPYKIK